MGHYKNNPLSALPPSLPIFPLYSVMLLPGGHLPLNIFESHYIAMLEDALRSDRLIGMIQPQHHKTTELYAIGCAGKITEFVETPDGRYEIVLTGICRFKIVEELTTTTGYRRIKPDWNAFADDLMPAQNCLGLDRNKIKASLARYFDKQNMQCDWNAIDAVTDAKLMTCLSMICPFSAAEKQALLEEKCCKQRANILMTMLEMEIY
jgi:Lon protease-like protein